MKYTPQIAIAFAVLALTPAARAGQECAARTEALDMTAEQVDQLYGCIEARLLEGYTAAGNGVAAAYRGWAAAATRPAVAATHGDRFVLTFVNEIGAEQYLRYASDGIRMPTGSVVAKESYKLENGRAKPGPLFIMTKVGDGEAPETGDWAYSALQPNGQEMAVKPSFCHDCHAAFEGQDALGYPQVDVRVSLTE